MSEAASHQWVALFPAGRPAVDATKSVVCTVKVLRPGRHEDPVSSPDNQVSCQVEGEGSPRVQYFADAKIESWGQEADRGFELKGGSFVPEMLEKFRGKTAGLPDSASGVGADPQLSMWWRAGLCDPFGGFCTQIHILNESPGADSAGQAECKRDTELTRPSNVDINPDDYSAYPDYIEAMVSEQIKQGDRKVVSERCLFI